MPRKTLGIIGGMGPMATVLLMKLIVKMTMASHDQEHIPILLRHCPYIPDRTAFILDASKPDPLDYIVDEGKKLVEDGVCEIAIPCVTAHYFHAKLNEMLSVPVINGVEEVIDRAAMSGDRTVGIMATDGTIKARLFEAFADKAGISYIYPEPSLQRKVMEIIYGSTKAGRSADVGALYEIREALAADGADEVILGCTELSVIADECGIQDDFLDVTFALARRCVSDMGILREEYR